MSYFICQLIWQKLCGPTIANAPLPQSLLGAFYEIMEAPTYYSLANVQ
ncbi:hypothetical protein [Vibrio gallaecicus]|nr:hypothetical protein [Vibrio gallaecicus]MDN3616675.1 hypothetical protein [Vibrio gallaecicus]